MRKHSLSFLSRWFQPFLFSADHVVKAQQTSFSADKARSAGLNAATWSDKKVPAKTRWSPSEDMDVVLDVTPPALHGLTINGKLSFANNKDLN